ncbi:uncharacterized protein LOC127720417 [Mytilus californianus]|uniref:uncharacterized protein LOC127720417 n=1 Tax=Mytilus californianus TaxID=6549 RepID=UPI002245F1E4|nr:uncharacterized protein LOC127720417 [Mytilus californianus]
MASDSEGEVDFPRNVEQVQMWASTMKLNPNTASELIRLGFDSMEAISLIEKEDMPAFNIPLGQQKVLMRAVGKTFKDGRAEAGNMADTHPYGNENKATQRTSARIQNGGTSNQDGDGVNNKDGDDVNNKDGGAHTSNPRSENAYVQEILKMMSREKNITGQFVNDSHNSSTGSLVSREVRSLDSIVANFRCHSYAESTKKTYLNYFKSYAEFCRRLNITLVPLSPMNLARYVAYLSSRLQFNSITNYLSIVRLLHLESGVASPIDSFFMESVLKGAKRVLGAGIHRKLPITPKILNEIFTLLSVSSSKDLCFWAACLVAFFSFLRKSNLFAPSISAFDPLRHFTREEIHFHSDGVCLKVRKNQNNSIFRAYIRNSPS